MREATRKRVKFRGTSKAQKPRNRVKNGSSLAKMDDPWFWNVKFLRALTFLGRANDFLVEVQEING